MKPKHRVIEEICKALQNGNQEIARGLLRTKYPFTSLIPASRRYSNYEKSKIFLRDGFIDRYSGKEMIFPPVLRILSSSFPKEFPFQKNWKMSECHLAYWQLLPTIDHIIPVSRGGIDDESNWVCTSQLRNSAKSNWLLEELGWTLHNPGDISKWDGLVGWFLAYKIDNPEILEDKYINSWSLAIEKATNT